MRMRRVETLCLGGRRSRVIRRLYEPLGPPLLPGRLLLTCDGSLGPLVSTGVRVRPLPANRQTAPVPKASVATDVHEAFDVHGDFGSQSTFDLEVAFDLTTKLVYIVVIEVLRAPTRVDATSVNDLLRARRTDPIDIR